MASREKTRGGDHHGRHGQHRRGQPIGPHGQPERRLPPAEHVGQRIARADELNDDRHRDDESGRKRCESNTP